MIQGRIFFIFLAIISGFFGVCQNAYAQEAFPLNGELIICDHNNNRLEISQGQTDNTAFIKFQQPIKYSENKFPEEKNAAIPVVKLAPEELEAFFNFYGIQFNVDPGVLRKIAACESGFNSNAVNGPFGGMFQFLASTWSANRQVMGLDPNPDLRFQAEESIKTAAFKISRDGTGAWPTCSR